MGNYIVIIDAISIFLIAVFAIFFIYYGGKYFFLSKKILDIKMTVDINFIEEESKQEKMARVIDAQTSAEYSSLGQQQKDDLFEVKKLF